MPFPTMDDSEARFRRLMDTAPVMIWVSGSDKLCTFFNEPWLAFTGRSIEQELGNGWAEGVHPEDFDRCLEIYVSHFDRREPFRMDYRLRRADGEYRWILDTGVPRHAEDGSFQGYIGSCIDITTSKLAERDLATTLERREQTLVELQHLEKIGALTGGIAHDFKNLLSVIGGNLELLDQRVTGDPSLHRLAQAALHSVERGARLAQCLIGIAQQQRLTPQKTNLNELAREMAELLKRSAGPGIAITTRLKKDLWAAAADPGQLQMALLNLCLNARDAMPGGGTLSIETANATLRSEAIEPVPPGEWIMLKVADTGTGMPPDILEHACRPFFTTKTLGKGTGLGLSQVHGFLRQSGGYLTIDSAPGTGTTVRAYLPRWDDQAAASPVRKKTVLVVDDEAHVRQLAVDILSELGFEVVTAASGAEALRLLEREATVSLLFTDIVMPGLSGFELARQATRLRPRLKVLYTSGKVTDAADPPAPGRILRKPYQRRDLDREIHDALASGTL